MQVMCLTVREVNEWMAQAERIDAEIEKAMKDSRRG